MIVPSIDLMDGRAVQLQGGAGAAVVTADPVEMMEQFARVGEVAVIDLDAALGKGSNSDLIEVLAGMGRVRVGGGIRDSATAIEWLDRGADKVIVGTAATEPLLSELPHERVIVAVDSRDSAVLSHGWQTETGTGLTETVERFRGLCGGFLITFVEREGRMSGTDLARAESIVELAMGTKVTIAGGISTRDEIAALDRIGADAQVGMALYTGRLSLADGFTAPLTSDRVDGLWPTVVCDVHGQALGLAWSSAASIGEALNTGRGVYHSRSRGIWVKGDSSGAVQRLVSVDADCDRDALRFTVSQAEPGFCHSGTQTCWGSDRGIPRLAKRLKALAVDRPTESNTVRLLDEASLLKAKLIEEAEELADAASKQRVTHEAADLIYLTLAKAASAGVSVDDIARTLEAREQRVTRRPMVAKNGESS